MMWKILLICFLSLPVVAQGMVMVAGGGAEGDQGDTTAWSYDLYGRLIDNGDIDSDGVIRVAILATEIPNQPADANWLPNYFAWIGTTKNLVVNAFNVEVANRAAANNVATVGMVASADVVFIKGGDQGVYYDEWNGTLLEANIRSVANNGGALGGTSAGAMSMAEYSFSGGNDLISSDVMANAHTPYLEDADSPGSSGIHTDFFGFIDGVVVDTHYTQRGRLGRLAGILGKAIDDHADSGILGVGLEMKTGLVIQGDLAEVRGIGSVTFLRGSTVGELVRDVGKPLWFTDVRMDRLTEGWIFDLNVGAPVLASAPTGTFSVSPLIPGRLNSGALIVNGSQENDKEKFGHTGDFYPDDYQRRVGSGSPYILDSTGFTDAGNNNNRMDKHETLFHLLFDQPEDLGFLAFSGGSVERTTANPDVVTFSGNGTIVIDATGVSHKGLSPYESNWATAGGALRAATLVGLKLHIFGDSASRGKGFNTATRQLADISGGNPGGGISEQEPNDDLSSAEDYRSGSFPATIIGAIATESDQDHFKIRLSENETLNLTLSVPVAGDYDLYLLDRRGRTVTRSVNNGSGVNESINYTHTNRRTRTYYVLVESYTGSSTSETYSLLIDK